MLNEPNFSGRPQKMIGCGGYTLIVFIVAAVMAAFVGGVWWILHDIHQL